MRGPGTVTFRLYSDAARANQVFVSSNLTLNLTTATSGDGDVGDVLAPANTGQYFWRAFYSGVERNLPVSGACGACRPDEHDRPGTAGDHDDTADQCAARRVGQRYREPDRSGEPGRGVRAPGTVTFRLYSDAARANQVFVSSNRTLNLTSPTAGTSTSETFTPTSAGLHLAGVLQRRDNNLPVSGALASPARDERHRSR